MPDSTDPFDFARYGATPAARAPAGSPASGSPWGGAEQPRTGFDHEQPSGGELVAGRPPVLWIAAAAASAVAGGAVALVLAESLAFTLLGWFLAGPVAVGLLALFTARDTLQRVKFLYAAPPWVSPAYRVTVGLALISLVVAASRVADLVARR